VEAEAESGVEGCGMCKAWTQGAAAAEAVAAAAAIWGRGCW